MTADGPVYALNLFDVADRDEYLAYSRRSAAEVARHGGRVVALGKFATSIEGDIEPREALILVEWKSRAHFDAYREDPSLSDLHPHREAGGGVLRLAPSWIDRGGIRRNSFATAPPCV